MITQCHTKSRIASYLFYYTPLASIVVMAIDFWAQIAWATRTMFSAVSGDPGVIYKKFLPELLHISLRMGLKIRAGGPLARASLRGGPLRSFNMGKGAVWVTLQAWGTSPGESKESHYQPSHSSTISLSALMGQSWSLVLFSLHYKWNYIFWLLMFKIKLTFWDLRIFEFLWIVAVTLIVKLANHFLYRMGFKECPPPQY